MMIENLCWYFSSAFDQLLSAQYRAHALDTHLSELMTTLNVMESPLGKITG